MACPTHPLPLRCAAARILPHPVLADASPDPMPHGDGAPTPWLLLLRAASDGPRRRVVISCSSHGCRRRRYHLCIGHSLRLLLCTSMAGSTMTLPSSSSPSKHSAAHLRAPLLDSVGRAFLEPQGLLSRSPVTVGDDLAAASTASGVYGLANGGVQFGPQRRRLPVTAILHTARAVLRTKDCSSTDESVQSVMLVASLL